MLSRYITVGKCETPATVKQFLKAHGYTEHQIRHLKYVAGGILKNKIPCRAVNPVKIGDTIQVMAEDASYEEIPWPVLYEDEDVLIINKPAGLVVHPAHGHYEESLVTQLGDTVRIIGRLDQDTSGVFMLAKNAIAAERLQKQRWDGVLIREYLAIVHGIPQVQKGTVTKPLCGVASGVNRMTTEIQEGAESLSAVTHYEVVNAIGNLAVVKLHIETGRTHQIRVHMASVGHSLVADPIYGNGPELGMERTALHAWKLHFTQPFSGEKLTVTAEIPEDMNRILK